MVSSSQEILIGRTCCLIMTMKEVATGPGEHMCTMDVSWSLNGVRLTLHKHITVAICVDIRIRRIIDAVSRQQCPFEVEAKGLMCLSNESDGRCQRRI